MPKGEPSLISGIGREDRRPRLLTVFHHAISAEKNRDRQSIPFRQPEGGIGHLNLIVRPLIAPGSDNLFLVVFEEHSLPPGARKGKGKGNLRPLRRKSPGSQSWSRNFRAPRNTSRPRWRNWRPPTKSSSPTNEELQSTNEELQSTNEELETGKEELQSTNEELVTVNSELNNKINELTETVRHQQAAVQHRDRHHPPGQRPAH